MGDFSYRPRLLAAPEWPFPSPLGQTEEEESGAKCMGGPDQSHTQAAGLVYQPSDLACPRTLLAKEGGKEKGLQKIRRAPAGGGGRGGSSESCSANSQVASGQQRQQRLSGCFPRPAGSSCEALPEMAVPCFPGIPRGTSGGGLEGQPLGHLQGGRLPYVDLLLSAPPAQCSQGAAAAAAGDPNGGEGRSGQTAPRGAAGSRV